MPDKEPVTNEKQLEILLPAFEAMIKKHLCVPPTLPDEIRDAIEVFKNETFMPEIKKLNQKIDRTEPIISLIDGSKKGAKIVGGFIATMAVLLSALAAAPAALGNIIHGISAFIHSGDTKQ